LLASGLRPSFDNISGYTLGFYASAGPRTSDFTRIFHPGARWRLEPQLVFHMYASAQAASLSETVLVTEQGPERLTQLPRAPFVNPRGTAGHGRHPTHDHRARRRRRRPVRGALSAAVRARGDRHRSAAAGRGHLLWQFRADQQRHGG